MSGIQALVRLMLDQRRLDAARGLDTGMFVSGYQGSPLGGLDKELRARRRAHRTPAGIVFQPGLNEELAATAVAGTQLLGELEGRRHDGVTGFWYGKNPGLDRAADAIRHGNLVRHRAAGRRRRADRRRPGRPSPRPCPAPASRCAAACWCRCSRPARSPSCSTSACTPSRSRATAGCGPG